MEQKLENILNRINPEILNNKEFDLIEEGFLDSLRIMYLVSKLEEEFGIYFEPEDISQENFSTVESIEQILQKYVDAQSENQ